MAASLRKFLRKSPPARFLSTLRSPSPAPISLIHHQTLSIEPNPGYETNPNNVLPLLGFIKGENLIHSQAPVFYPSFPFGLISGPVSLPVSIQSELDEDADSGTIWADSVKKKRKKKMNKHKYKKLRKRLRRKT